jgi:hypothetical protein
MKTIFKIIALVLISALLFHYTFNTVAPSADKPKFKHSNASEQPVHVSNNLSNVFNFKIKTILSTNAKVTNQSIFEGKLIFKPNGVNNDFIGQVNNVKIVSVTGKESNTVTLSNNIPFKFKYNNFVFENINLLNLAPDHPVNAVKVLLKQLSYQLDNPLKIASATDTTEYRYQRDENTITRSVLSKQYLSSDLNLQKVNETEGWNLLLGDRNNIIKLIFTNQNLYKNDLNTLNLKQEIEVTLNDTNPEFQKLSYDLNANSHIAGINLMQPKKHEILSESDLFNAISQLKHNMQNEILLSDVGHYLSEHFDTDKLLSLLHNNPDASALIYALQKSNTQKSEISLINLLEHPDLQAQNQQRVIMSLARVQNASDYTFTSLKAVADNKDHQYASTALLNLGTVAKASPNLVTEVEQYLTDQLINSSKTVMTLLAINNSGSNKLNKQVSSLLGNKNAEVNIAALKILSKDIKYQDRLIDYVNTSDNPKEVIVLTQSLSGTGRSLTPSQKAIIEDKLAKTEHPILKTQLSALLAISNKSF